ncbi:glycosyltransferase family 9 protein [Klebsiella pneumoniae]
MYSAGSGRESDRHPVHCAVACRAPACGTFPQILFNPYASRRDKGISPSCATAALHAITDEFPGYSVGILCSPSTLHSAQHLENAVARDNVAVLYDGLTPEKVAGYIRRAQAVVSVDTAIVHMAVGLKAKLVAIYPLITGQHNPWLPPRSPFTQVIYSEQQPDTFRRTGKKIWMLFR